MGILKDGPAVRPCLAQTRGAAKSQQQVLRKSGLSDNLPHVDKDTEFTNTGHVGRRGSIVLPAASRRRYGLADGSLFISEEREDGILIRPATAVPVPLDDLRRKIKAGLDQLDRGEGLDGEEVLAEMKRESAAFKARQSR